MTYLIVTVPIQMTTMTGFLPNPVTRLLTNIFQRTLIRRISITSKLLQRVVARQRYQKRQMFRGRLVKARCKVEYQLQRSRNKERDLLLKLRTLSALSNFNLRLLFSIKLFFIQMPMPLNVSINRKDYVRIEVRRNQSQEIGRLQILQNEKLSLAC